MSTGILIFAAGAALLASLPKSSTPAAETTDSPPTDQGEDVTVSPPDTWTKYDVSFQAVSAFYEYPWSWLKALCLNETLLGTDTFYVAHGQGSSDGKSSGIMQLTIPTASDVAGIAVTADELRDDNFSIEIAGKYLHQLYVMFSGDERKTIMSYNQGPGNTTKGHEYAANYYDRWLRWKLKVESGDSYL